MQPILSSSAEWTLIRKIMFRFFCCFFILYIFPFPFIDFPFGNDINKFNESILGWYNWIWEQVFNFWKWFIPLVGRYLLRLETPITIFTNGSGDTTFDYVLLLTQFLIAAVVSTAWVYLDRKRKSYNAAYYWLCVLVRYYLASMMMIYGFVKIFHLQMGSPSLTRLVQPYGDSSPMGLVWTYVGQSKVFSAIVGLSECLCGALLLFRKTTLLGALLSLVVMGNVMIINLCYDVPVKLFSSMLELMALFLAWPYFKILFRLFIQHKPGVLENYVQPVLKRKWVRITIITLKTLFIADALYYGIIGNIASMKEYGDLRTKPILYGIYNAELIIKNRDTVPLLITDTAAWKQIVIDREGIATIKTMNDTSRRYTFQVDPALKRATVFSNTDTIYKKYFKYQLDSTTLTLSGQIYGDTVFLKFSRYDERKFLLMNRDFRWINEYPFNR